MPVKVQGPDGQSYEFPDGTTKDTAVAYFSAKAVGGGGKTGGGVGTPTGLGTSPSPTGDLRAMTPLEDIDSIRPMGAKGQSLLDNVKAAGHNFTTGFNQMLEAGAHPLRTGKALLDQLNPTSSTPNPLKQVYDGLNTRPGETATTLAGNAAAGEAMGAAGKAVVPAAAAALDTAGDAAKGAGRWVGEATAKTNTLDREFNTRPGAGISENRIIAATRPSLMRKVKGKVPELKAQETSILSNSQSPPIDVSSSVNNPFNDIRAEKTHPVTGVAVPAQVKQLSLTQAILNAQQDPITGQPVPFPRQQVMAPVDAAQLKSNIGEMANYDTLDNTLANQALKGAGAGLRDQITKAVPESAPATQLLHDTLGLRDKLQTQLGGTGQAMPHGQDIITKAINAVADPALVMGGTTTATLLDLLGGGLKRVGGALHGTPAPVPAPPAPGAVAPAPHPQLPAPGVALPQLPGYAPPPPPPGGAIPMPSQWGPNVTPPPIPPAGALPAATDTTAGLVGPEGRFRTRLANPSRFGPAVDTNGFMIHPQSLTKQISGDTPIRRAPDTSHPSMGSQEEANVGAAQSQTPADGFANQASQESLLNQVFGGGKGKSTPKPSSGDTYRVVSGNKVHGSGLSQEDANNMRRHMEMWPGNTKKFAIEKE